jgi:dihydroxyacetone kinase
MSALEMGAVADETLTQLESRGIVPVRIFNGPFMGSMNMPGISLSLLNLTNVANECGFTSVEKLLELIDAPHRSSAWPANQNRRPLPEKFQRKRVEQFTEVEEEKKEKVHGGPKISSKSRLNQSKRQTRSHVP